MARRLNIIGLGEALLIEYPDRTGASGIASCIAVEAVRLGHVGIIVSRIGQDPQASTLLEILRAAGADTSHVQQDPDLPTGRVIVRAAGGTIARYLDSPAAFDNLQSDFDLEDIAQQADAVVFGLLARREGQTRSEENRFLGMCAAATKLIDLTNRGRDESDRRHVYAGLEMADAALVDREALGIVTPGSTDRPQREVILEMMRDAGLTFVLGLDDEDEAAGQNEGVRPMTLHTAEATEGALIPDGPVALAATCVVLLDTLLRGRELPSSMSLARRVAEHAVNHSGEPGKPGEPVPAEWLA